MTTTHLSGTSNDVRLQALHQRFFPKMVNLCQKMLNNQVLGEEAAQDVWTDFVLLHASRVNSDAATEAYVRLMTVRRCRRMRTLEARQSLLTEAVDERDDPEAELIAADEERFRQTRLARCMEQLDGSARKLLRMRYHLGMTQESIGAQLGVSKQYAGRILTRTIEALRNCVEAA